MTVIRKVIIGFVLALAIGNRAGVVLGETFKECQVPQDYKTIQAAIDDETCDTVTVAPGTYKENLKIERSLKITGIDREKVIILGKELGYPVILIQGSQDVRVTIEGLSLAEAKADYTKYGGCADRPICPAGMVIRGEVGVTIQGAKITGNASDGIFLLNSAKATISNTIISGNAVGCSPGWICMGIDVADAAQATISEMTVADNKLAGIWVRRSAQARIVNSQISGNGLDGISLSDRGTVEIRGNRIFNNIRCGVHAIAWEWDLEVRVTGERNEIFDNKEGDLCPLDFAWPVHFIKPPSIELMPNEAVTGKIGPKMLTEASKDQYYIAVDSGAKLLAIKLESAGNLDMHVRYGQPVERSGQIIIADFSLVAADGKEFIIIFAPQLKPGLYFIAIENEEETEQEFTIIATPLADMRDLAAPGEAKGSVDPNAGLIPFLRQYLATRGGMLGLVQYRFDVPTEAKSVIIHLNGPADKNLNLHLRYERPIEIVAEQIIADVSVIGPGGQKGVVLTGDILKFKQGYIAIESLEKDKQDYEVVVEIVLSSQRIVIVLEREP